MLLKKSSLFLLTLLLSAFIPLSADAVSKKSNYQDFTAWYQKNLRVKTVPWQAAVLLDAQTLEPLYFYQENTVIPTASLIKLITAGAALEYKPDWHQRIDFTPAENGELLTQYLDPADKFSRLILEPGETMSLEQGFATMLMSSANNAAVALPRWVGATRAEFIQQMRATAVKWGLTNTTIDEPSGLSLKNTSTAYDMARAACQAFSQFMITHYSSKPSYNYALSSGREKIIKHTAHDLRRYPQNYWGVKTGYLDETKFHIVSGLYTPSGRKVCGAVLSVARQTDSEQALTKLAHWADLMYRWK